MSSKATSIELYPPIHNIEYYGNSQRAVIFSE